MVKRKRQPGLLEGMESHGEEGDAVSKVRDTGKGATRPSSGYNRAPATQLSKPTKVMSEPATPRNRIQAGLDFGTTHSAFAFVSSLRDENEIEVNTTWPGGPSRNDCLEKVPSRFAYAIENNGMEEDCWGCEVPADAKSYDWFKLLLDDSDQSGFDSEQLRGELASGLLQLPDHASADELVKAYLSKMHAHCMAMLEQRYGASVLEVTPMDVWLTVPATWADEAVATTKSAAKAAGFGSRARDTLNIITEPEAAAIAILSKAADANPEVVKAGNHALICDLGGGTLDYQILKILRASPRLETEEAIPGIAGKSGSTFIDIGFHEWMESTFGTIFTSLDRSKTGHGSPFMRDWEAVKTSFSGQDLNKHHQIRLPALGRALSAPNESSCSYDDIDHCVVITGHEIAKLFEPVITTAIRLVDQQIAQLSRDRKRAELQMICLCGGLGESMYVWQRFKEHCRDKLDGRCALFTDRQAWSAVVRGAAMRGLNGNLVLSKKAKRCYGIGVHKPFRNGFDEASDAFDCEFGGKRADGYVAWFIKMEVGKSINPKMDIRLSLYEAMDGQDETRRYTLYSCAKEEPPERAKDPDVKTEGTIKLDLSKVNKSGRAKETQDGQQKLEFRLVAKLGDSKGTIRIQAKPCGSQIVLGEAEIDYTRSHARRRQSQAPGIS